jgi:hypothetical protein
MADVLYTTTDAIRAAVGVTEVEVKDSQITDLNVEDQLEIYLDQVYPDHAALVDANEEGADPAPTPEQISDWKKLKLLCQYAAAVILLQAGQNLLVQAVTEGGTSMSRFSRNDIETTLARLEGMRDQFLSALTGVSPAEAYMVSPFKRVSPDYDPVRGC